MTILRGHRKRQFEERFVAGWQWRDTGLVFTTAPGRLPRTANVNRMFHRPCETANVPQLRVHDLRHSCATLLFTMGVQPAISSTPDATPITKSKRSSCDTLIHWGLMARKVRQAFLGH